MMDDLPEIRTQLFANAEALAVNLLGQPNKSKTNERQLRFGTHGSLAVELAGPKAGCWFDYEAYDGGDLLKLIQHVRGIGFPDAVAWARSWLGQSPDYHPSRIGLPYPRGTSDVNINAGVAGACPTVLRPRDGTVGQDRKKAESIARIWAASMPPWGSVVERYLASRGIEIPIPHTIRCHPSLRYDGLHIGPAMVARISVWPSVEPVALHRTWLRLDGSGKADVPTPKKMLGPVRGGAVRLGRVDHRLIIAEGIETGLSLLQATDRPVWAALSTSGMRALVLPELPFAGVITIAADADEAGIKAAEACRKKWLAEGRTVHIAVPGTAGADFNDILQETTG